jgi:FAD/FMN-containing dehydrogenase
MVLVRRKLIDLSDVAHLLIDYSVGIGGLSLHGGYGYSSRLHGLTLDNLVEADVVIADGSLVTASATENTDLFWALRGAGSCFGIVTSFKFKTFAAPTNNVIFSYNIPASTVNDTANSINAIQNFGNTETPPELNMRVLCNSYQNQLIGVYYGTIADFKTTIAPLLSELKITSGSVRNTSWIGALSNYAYGDLTIGKDYSVHETFVSSQLPSLLQLF